MNAQNKVRKVIFSKMTFFSFLKDTVATLYRIRGQVFRTQAGIKVTILRFLTLRFSQPCNFCRSFYAVDYNSQLFLF